MSSNKDIYEIKEEVQRTIADELKERNELESDISITEEANTEEPEWVKEFKMGLIEKVAEEPIILAEDTPKNEEIPQGHGLLTADERSLLRIAIEENGAMAWIMKRPNGDKEELRMRVIGHGESITVDSFSPGSKFANLNLNKMYFPSNLNLYKD